MGLAEPAIPLNPFPHIGFTVAFNMSEQPAVSVNCGFDDDGLPIGLQIVGRRFDDVGVLAVARAYEDDPLGGDAAVAGAAGGVGHQEELLGRVSPPSS